MKNKIILFLLLSLSLQSREIEATVVLSGLYTQNDHFQEYKTDLTVKEQQYNRAKNPPLKVSIRKMIELTGKVNFQKTDIRKIIPKQNKFEFDIYVKGERHKRV